MLSDLLAQARLLIAPYLMLIRLVSIVVAAVVVVLGFWRIHVWHEAFQREAVTQKRLDEASRELEGLREASRAAERAHADAIGRAATVAQENQAHAVETQTKLERDLAAADARGRDLARRMRVYEASRAACSGPTAALAGAATVDADASGDTGGSGGVAQATAGFYRACFRDAGRLNAWVAWYEGVRDDWRRAGFPVAESP